MYGAIIGDIVGSYYEVLEVNAIKKEPDKKRKYEDRIRILDKNEPLFTDKCSYTDDTVLTIAIAKSILEKIPYEECLRKFGLAEQNLGLDSYGRNRFGKGFVSWLNDEKKGDSYGNGASMRISPVAYYFEGLEKINEEAKKATIPSHNNEEAIIGAQAVSSCIYLSRKGKTKEEIKKYIEEQFNYNLDFNIEELQKTYRFSSKTIGSVPQAIFCFLESTSFEDCLRKSISIGGDTDTIACISCSIAEAFYGIPKNILEEAMKYLPEKYKIIVDNFYKELEIKNIIYDLNICNDDFWNYMHSRTKRINIGLNSGIWGTFVDNIIGNEFPNIKVLVPYLTTDFSYKINIHEYAHAYELYNLAIQNKNLNSLNKDESESFAKEKEEEYTLKKVL